MLTQFDTLLELTHRTKFSKKGRNKVGIKLSTVQPCFTKLYPPFTYRLLFNCRKPESIRVARQSCHVKKALSDEFETVYL